MFLSFVFSNKKNDFSYVPLENKEIYSILEYSILKKNFPGIFILNQPFTKFNSELLIDDYHIFNVYYHNNI